MIQDIIYTILRSISAGIGLYSGFYFWRLYKELPHPPHYRFPFLMLCLANFSAFVIYSLAVLHVDGFGAISNTGRIVQILVLVYQIMPVIIAKNMKNI